MDTDLLIQLYNDVVGADYGAEGNLDGTEATVSIEPLGESGSNRRYFRLGAKKNTGEQQLEAPVFIGVIGESIEENESFIYLSQHFHSCGINVPQVVAVSPDRRCYLQTDLGNTALFDFIAPGRTSGNFSEEEHQMVGQTIECLPHIQFAGAEGLDFLRCYPGGAFDSRLVNWDLNYFKYCFLKTAAIDFNEALLEDDFQRLTREVTDGECATFMYRDFQSRNVMISHNRPAFIDFQGGRRGPCEYDVASFLWQAKAGFPPAMRSAMIERYVAAARRYELFDEEKFRRRMPLFVLLRTLQVLGAYGFRGLHEHKQHFIESIPGAVTNLAELFDANQPLQTLLPEIYRISGLLQNKFLKKEVSDGRLVIDVWSFSYKKGIPADDSGNGGGFVFDCRGMHNPGRYEEYKPLTGRDLPVIEFLETQGEVQHFLQNVYELVDPTVATYLRRGFTHLSVAFGCTGGRHRSVYCAEHLAAHLHNKFPTAEIRLRHREQGIYETFSPSQPS